MNAKLRLARSGMAEAAVTVVLREMDIIGPRVEPEEIAPRKVLLVKPKPHTAAGVSRMLVKAGDEFGILYATNIQSRGFQKFSIAHEIGHYCIEGHIDALLTTSSRLAGRLPGRMIRMS